MFKKHVFFAILLFLGTSAAFAQSTSVNRDSITVGDTIGLNVTFSASKSKEIIVPDEEKDFGELVVRNMSTSRKEGSKRDTLSYNFVLTTYKPQNCTIPELPFIVQTDSISDTLFTQPIPITVLSVIPAADSGVTLRELKEQQPAGKAPLWWLWLIGAALLVTGVFFLIRLLRKEKVTEKPFIPPKPPYQEAMEALKKLESRDLIQQGYIQEYVFELSEIFKRYIGRRYKVNASEFTTEEMLSWLSNAKISKELRMNAEWFFRTTDPVKFARLIPEMNVLKKFDQEVKAFLEATKPVSVTTEQTKETHTSNQETERKA
ncbi:MAG: DUF4381 family protein [Chitinispirillaceae bacterium]